MTDKNTTTATRFRKIAYWITTALLAWELAFGALWDFNLVNRSFVSGIMQHLGYPPYLAIIIGLWKVPGAIAVLIPGSPTLKEWTYAGAFFTFSGAAASHFAVGDGVGAIIAPLIFAAVTIASWALRPPSRRLAAS
jgi:hypothetical protein